MAAAGKVIKLFSLHLLDAVQQRAVMLPLISFARPLEYHILNT
jgi:hypothetical protein